MQGINKREYIKRILSFGSYIKGPEIAQLKQNVANIYGRPQNQVLLTSNGRAAQYLFLKSLKLTSENNIVMQGFTCNAAVGPNLWAGVNVKYVDIDTADYSLSLDSLKNTVDENTKVIVVQHTFGIPSKIDEVVEFAHKKGILVFEDCAHAFGMKDEKGRTLGTLADATLISFGIDKVLNSRVGGALLINNLSLLPNAQLEYLNYPEMTVRDTFVWLLNPFVWYMLAKFKGARKSIARFFTRIGLLNMGFYSCEFKPEMPKQYPRRISNALAWFVNQEIETLDVNLNHREKVVKLYQEAFKSLSNKVEFNNYDRTLVKFPILLPNRDNRNSIYEKLMSKGFLVSKWYDPVIFPEGKGLDIWRYKEGSAPNAENVAGRILALPTGMNMNEVRVSELVDIINANL